jgi:hypothetical protein
MRLRALFLIFAFGRTAVVAFADQPTLAPAQALAIIERPTTARDLKRAYAAILTHASPQTLGDLKKSTNTALALSAAWRETIQDAVILDAPGNKVNPAFARFVGFVDGRLPVELPLWWETTVTDVHGQYDGDSAAFPLVSNPFADEKAWPHAPRGVTTKQVRAGLEVWIEGVQIPVAIPATHILIPEDLLKRARVKWTRPGWEDYVSQAGIVSPIVDGDSVFVVIASGKAYADPSVLARFDRTSGKLLWESEVWLGNRLSSISTSATSFDDIVEPRIGRDGNVYVFGTTLYSAYIEAFARTDGALRFRFGTVYLQEWQSL